MHYVSIKNILEIRLHGIVHLVENADILKEPQFTVLTSDSSKSSIIYSYEVLQPLNQLNQRLSNVSQSIIFIILICKTHIYIYFSFTEIPNNTISNVSNVICYQVYKIISIFFKQFCLSFLSMNV